jgi:hypothetical protein
MSKKNAKMTSIHESSSDESSSDESSSDESGSDESSSEDDDSIYEYEVDIKKIFSDISIMMKNGKKIKDITSYLNVNIPDYRKKFTNYMDPDDECEKARRLAKKRELLNSSHPLYQYKNFTARNDIALGSINILKTRDTKNIIAWNHENKIMESNEIINDNNENYTAIGKGYCGNCWLCGFPVYFYFSGEDEDGNSYVSACGDCEHIGAIGASLLSGMLASSSGDGKIFNYGTSHRHCNQMKSNKLSMKFDKSKKLWVVDYDEIERIITSIVHDGVPHENEYDPEFKQIIINGDLNKDKMRTRIENYTKKWCNKANDLLKSVTTHRRDIALAIVKILMYTFNKVRKRFIKLTGKSKGKLKGKLKGKGKRKLKGKSKGKSGKRGGYKSNGTDILMIDKISGFGIDSNLNDETVDKMLTELRKDPVFYELLDNLIKSFESKRFKTHEFSSKSINESKVINKNKYYTVENKSIKKEENQEKTRYSNKENKTRRKTQKIREGSSKGTIGSLD